jgi:hypothetical protein
MVTTARATSMMSLLTLLALLPACASNPPPVPAKSLDQKKAERDPNAERQREPRHVAPPPAYGNKVVLAHAEESDSSG